MTKAKSAPAKKQLKKSSLSNATVVKKSQASTSKPSVTEDFLPVNQVRLVGRVTSLAVEKELPSGDKVVEFRVVIGRGKIRNGKKEVDSLDIAAWSGKARKAALAVKIDTWVEVKGAVRRRFWRAPTGLASRWQVEASEVVRL
jgi:single-strand DNA-binding protein